MHLAAADRRKPNYLVIVLSFSVVLGMAVAVGVYFAWTSGAITPGLEHPLTVIALVFCPPFILSLVVAPKPDSDLALVLVVGTTVFANAFLYAGVAAIVYFVVGVCAGRKRDAT
jgi:hypothetical protein